MVDDTRPAYDDAGLTLDPAMVRVVNRTGRPVRVFDVDQPGQPRGTYPTGWGESFTAYAGTVLAVRDVPGKLLGTYRVDGDGGQVVVEPPPQTRPANAVPLGTSPDGRWRAVVRDGGLYVGPAGPDGLGYYDDPVWSADSRHLVALYQSGPYGPPLDLIWSSPTDDVHPRLLRLPHRRAVDPRVAVRPRLFGVAGWREVPIDPPPCDVPGMTYGPRWDADGKRFTFVFDDRGLARQRMFAVDADTGRATTIIDERSDTFVDVSSAGKFYDEHLDATREILWASERDGWNHL